MWKRITRLLYRNEHHFDVYGMAMMMIDLELASLQISNLSDVFAPSHMMQYNGIDSRFQAKPIYELNSRNLFQLIKTILDTESVKDRINNFIKEYNPNFETLVSKKTRALKWGVNKNSDFLFLSPTIFDTLVMSVMSYTLGKIYMTV